MEKKELDIESLKSKYNTDSLPFYIWSTVLDSKKRRDAYWRYYQKMRNRNNWLSVPLLVLTSASGITSVAQFGDNGSSLVLPIILTIFSVSSAVLTAIQRYFKYSERAEHSKYMAKSYARVARHIENNMCLLESNAIRYDAESFLKFVETFQQEIDTIMQETDELPKEILSNKYTNNNNVTPPSNNDVRPSVNIDMVSLQPTRQFGQPKNNTNSPDVNDVRAQAMSRAPEQTPNINSPDNINNLVHEINFLKDIIDKNNINRIEMQRTITNMEDRLDQQTRSLQRERKRNAQLQQQLNDTPKQALNADPYLTNLMEQAMATRADSLPHSSRRNSLT